jgi:hypothetical protein
MSPLSRVQNAGCVWKGGEVAVADVGSRFASFKEQLASRWRENALENIRPEKSKGMEKGIVDSEHV